MPRHSAGVGDRVEVAQHHRLAGSEGTIVAHADNPHCNRPSENYHIRFDRPTWGAIHKREIWLNIGDFVVVEKAPEDYVPPTDIEAPAPYGGD